MSSVHRQKGKPYLFCHFYDYDAEGLPVRRCKSTKTTNRKQAEKICAAMERTAKEAKLGKLTPDRARRIIEDAVSEIADAAGVDMPRQSVKEYFDGWLTAKGCSEGTRKRYQSVLDAFYIHLGPKAKHSLQSLTDRDILIFRDKYAGKVANGTVNFYLKVVRVALNRAVKKNLLTRSPAVGVDNLDTSDAHQRKPFKLAELKKILAAASEEWRTMILVGLYTGLRSSDCAGLTWANLDLANAQFTLTEKKTGKTRTLEIAKPLLRHLEGLRAGDNPTAPLCPSLYGKPPGWLSNQFYDLLTSVGMVPARDHKSKSKGRGVKRQQSALTFHSLRHTAVSLLKNAGVSDAIARDIIGHESEAVSRQYTHIESDTKREALNKMPDVAK
jgi:integrase